MRRLTAGFNQEYGLDIRVNLTPDSNMAMIATG